MALRHWVHITASGGVITEGTVIQNDFGIIYTHDPTPGIKGTWNLTTTNGHNITGSAVISSPSGDLMLAPVQGDGTIEMTVKDISGFPYEDDFGDAVYYAQIAYFAAPNTPSNLNGVIHSLTENDLSWDAPSDPNNIDGWYIYRNGVLFDGSDTNSYHDVYHPPPGTVYTIRAYNSFGESAPSNSWTSSPPVPSAPTGLTGTRDFADVNLSWNAVGGATGYNIYRGGVDIATATTTTYDDTTSDPTVQYTYYIKAVNGAGESAQSNTYTAVPFTTPPISPSDEGAGPTVKYGSGGEGRTGLGINLSATRI